jgi:3-dehydroquinate synthase
VTTILQRASLVLEYPVIFTRDVFADNNAALADAIARLEPARRHRFVAIVDAGVAARWPQLATSIEAYAVHHAERLALAAPPWHIPGGEPAKDRAVLERLWERLAELRLDRHACVVAIGGGAALDVIGFAAATLHRGLRVVRVPTTVLAQNDAGVGVKNAINAFGTKNMIGTFAAPFAVIDDSAFLATLEQRDRIAGMAEAVKVALIRDAAFFGWLEDAATRLAAFELAAVEESIRRCAALHLAHIADGGDPFEQGTARPLDFGHWAAHKLELLTHHELRHGEAVAIGMAVDTCYSVEAGLLDAASRDRVLALLRALGLPTWHASLRAPELLDGLAEFREHLGGELTITLLAAIGRGVDARDVRPDLVARAIERLA